MATVVLLLLLYTTFCVNERDTQKKITLILLPVQTNTIVNGGHGLDNTQISPPHSLYNFYTYLKFQLLSNKCTI